jgi:dTDP-glucose pyrophosphorylase
MNQSHVKPVNADWRKTILPPNATIREAIACMNFSSLRIVLVVNGQGQLDGTISDGDIRRGLLKDLNLDGPIESIVHRSALVVPPVMERKMVLQLMVANHIQQIPVVDKQNRVIGLHVWDDLVPRPVRSNRLVIMAGGKGMRLRPLTEKCPKPLALVAGKPILEHIIERAKLEGFSDFVIAVHYLGHMIEEYFGDGKTLNVNINYLRENTPLGTAGALSLLCSQPKEPFVITNGDILTDIRYGELIDFHIRYEAVATMAVRAHEWQHPFGVVQTRGVDIIGFEEKPITRTHINAGVYVLSPSALNKLEYEVPCDMPTLFERLQVLGLKTVAYPMHEPWLDVGIPADLERARETIHVASLGDDCNT